MLFLIVFSSLNVLNIQRHKELQQRS